MSKPGRKSFFSHAWRQNLRWPAFSLAGHTQDDGAYNTYRLKAGAGVPNNLKNGFKQREIKTPNDIEVMYTGLSIAGISPLYASTDHVATQPAK